jgi:hypothetical protein
MKIELWHDGTQKTVTAKLGTKPNP